LQRFKVSPAGFAAMHQTHHGRQVAERPQVRGGLLASDALAGQARQQR